MRPPVARLDAWVLFALLASHFADCSGLWWCVGRRASSAAARARRVVGRSVLLDHRRVCRRARQLKSQQRAMCRHEPEVVERLVEGAQIGLHECQYQLRYRRWNCTTAGRTLGKMLLRDTRETAFVQAITAAAAMQRVARACSNGQMENCGCRQGTESSAETDWSWAGCAHDIDFGLRKSREFMDAEHRRYRDVRAQLLKHNNEVGRLTTQSGATKKCKCHGMSGSCEFKTCFERLATFSESGERLRGKLDAATAVVGGNGIGGALWTRPPTPRADGMRRRSLLPDGGLVYTERSPDFCRRSRRLGVPGPRGRPCNATTGSDGSCAHLCCGRRHHLINTVHFEEQCNCRFHWCCEVLCESCQRRQALYSCT